MCSHCPEGDVGCTHLTALLVNNETGQETKLSGSTYMVKCADRLTPCHIGFYELSSPGIRVRAYPGGSLELDKSGLVVPNELGTWNN